MNSTYLREGQHYTFSDLKQKFSSKDKQFDDATTKKRLNLLRRCNIVKIVKKSHPEYTDLSDQDIVIGDIPEDTNELCYQFNFVGIILLDDLVLKCYPKYIDNKDELEDEELFSKLKTVIKVIKKYNKNEQLIYLYNGDDEYKNFNKLAISLYILQDYFENGLYSNQEEHIELNGEGEILWNKTIDETFAFIKNNTPYYLDFYTHENQDNDFDFIRRLHAAVVTLCSSELKKAEILELFDLDEVALTSETLSDFGETDYIKYRIEKELKNQFVTKKQQLLKTLYTYISEIKSNETANSFSLYGTNAFNLVWEKACAQVFENVYDEKLTVKKLLENGLISNECVNGENAKKKIKDYIEKPVWKVGGSEVLYDGDLIPDIVSLRKSQSGNSTLYILDGKYYLLKTQNGKLSGNPGIQDVVKQFVYNSALRSFINDFKIGEIANCFLIPALESESECETKDEQEQINFGSVSYWTAQLVGFKEIPEIQVIKLNPKEIWSAYLGNADNKYIEEIFRKIKTVPTENYLYHNENDNSILKPNDGKTHFVVGFLRRNYFDFIKSRLNHLNQNQDFIFYFYATDKNQRYPMHPYIDFCKKFIGYTEGENKTEFLQGELELLSNGRCKIDEISKDDLHQTLQSEYGKSVFFEGNAVTYYVMKVKNCEISSVPDEKIADFAKLENLIHTNGLNEVLFRTSPKVADV